MSAGWLITLILTDISEAKGMPRLLLAVMRFLIFLSCNIFFSVLMGLIFKNTKSWPFHNYYINRF